MNPLVKFILSVAGRAALLAPPMPLPKKGGRDKAAAGLAVGYPGAKLIRKAQMGLVGVKNKGMRASIRNLAQRRADARAV